MLRATQIMNNGILGLPLKSERWAESNLCFRSLAVSKCHGELSHKQNNNFSEEPLYHVWTVPLGLTLSILSQEKIPIKGQPRRVCNLQISFIQYSIKKIWARQNWLYETLRKSTSCKHKTRCIVPSLFPCQKQVCQFQQFQKKRAFSDIWIKQEQKQDLATKHGGDAAGPLMPLCVNRMRSSLAMVLCIMETIRRPASHPRHLSYLRIYEWMMQTSWCTDMDTTIQYDSIIFLQVHVLASRRSLTESKSKTVLPMQAATWQSRRRHSSAAYCSPKGTSNETPVRLLSNGAVAKQRGQGRRVTSVLVKKIWHFPNFPLWPYDLILLYRISRLHSYIVQQKLKKFMFPAPERSYPGSR